MSPSFRAEDNRPNKYKSQIRKGPKRQPMFVEGSGQVMSIIQICASHDNETALPCTMTGIKLLCVAASNSLETRASSCMTNQHRGVELGLAESHLNSLTCQPN